MRRTTGNLFTGIPATCDAELLDTLVATGTVRIERIVSRGHASPESGWYDQDENELVVVLHGRGRLLFDDGTEAALAAGDWIDIPAHRRHRGVDRSRRRHGVARGVLPPLTSRPASPAFAAHPDGAPAPHACRALRTRS